MPVLNFPEEKAVWHFCWPGGYPGQGPRPWRLGRSRFQTIRKSSCGLPLLRFHLREYEEWKDFVLGLQ